MADLLEHVRRAGLDLLGHFTLPPEAWWRDFYGPMEARLEVLRRQHGADPEALAALDELAREPALHRLHSECYGYEFVVARRLD